MNDVRRTLVIARPVRLLTSDAIETPLTGGWPRPAVLLPSVAESWSADRRRLVVQHELVHVARGDGLRRLAWRMVSALYWFHPLARIAARQAALAVEQACDETVVGLGTRPSLYARHLMDIAGGLRGQPALFASALPMVERNQLERRLVMILDTNQVSSRGRGVAITCIPFFAAIVVSVTCAAPARPQHANDAATGRRTEEVQDAADAATASQTDEVTFSSQGAASETVETEHEMPELAHGMENPVHERRVRVRELSEPVREPREAVQEACEPVHATRVRVQQPREPGHEPRVRALRLGELKHEPREPGHETRVRVLKRGELKHEPREPGHESRVRVLKLREPNHEMRESRHDVSDGAQSPDDFDNFGGTTRDGENTSFHTDLGNGRRLRARIHGPVEFDERTGAIRDLPHGSSVLIETRKSEKRSQRMLITEKRGEPRYEWWLNGEARRLDDDARAWLDEALAAMAAFRAIGEIRGHVGSLRGEIGSIQGHIGSLQGRIGSIRGEEGSLRGKIGSIHGERGSLQGEIGSHQGAIGSLRGARVSASNDLKQRIDREIRVHEAAIRELEAKRDDGAFSRRLEEAEAELRAFQKRSRGKIAELERQIDAIQSQNKIAELEEEIESVHAEERIEKIERRMAPTVERLKDLIDELGR